MTDIALLSNPDSADSDPGTWRRVLARPPARLAAAWIVLVLLACTLGSIWAAPRHAEVELQAARAAPSLGEPMGRDLLGRPLLPRVLLGGLISLGIGAWAAALSMLLGVAWGSVAGLSGARVDAVLMRVVDILYGLPYVLLVILLRVALDGLLRQRLGWGHDLTQVTILLLAIGGVSWLTMARVVRSQVLSLRVRPFIDAARAIGLSTFAIWRRHLLPNMAGPIAVYATLTIPQAILQESFLSFLGIGVQPPLPSWGNLAAEGVSAINSVQSFWWLLAFPCGLLTLTLLALNIVGDAFRDVVESRATSFRPTPHAPPAATPVVRRAARSPALLEITDLHVNIWSGARCVEAVRGVSLDLVAGRTLALVGESGCGKSLTALSLMRLLPENTAWISGGRIDFAGVDLVALSERRMREIRGRQIAMIFQEPMSALNPLMSIGLQVAEAVRQRNGGPRSAALRESVEWLREVGISDPARRSRQYPHELSGGMRQRAMIAMAIAARPRLLIADEPTTALDPTLQQQVLTLLSDLQKRHHMALLLITHDLGVVAQTADDVAVMYAGRVVERGPVRDVLTHPRHPYTAALLRCVPRLDGPPERLATIPGTVPAVGADISGCRFHPRCDRVSDDPRCRSDDPPEEAAGDRHRVRCWRADS